MFVFLFINSSYILFLFRRRLFLLSLPASVVTCLSWTSPPTFRISRSLVLLMSEGGICAAVKAAFVCDENVIHSMRVAAQSSVLLSLSRSFSVNLTCYAVWLAAGCVCRTWDWDVQYLCVLVFCAMGASRSCMRFALACGVELSCLALPHLSLLFLLELTTHLYSPIYH